MSDKSRQMTPEEAAEFAEQVFNKARVGLIKTISDALKLIFGSKTSTMMGPQPLLPASIEAPAKAQIIDSFGG